MAKLCLKAHSRMANIGKEKALRNSPTDILTKESSATESCTARELFRLAKTNSLAHGIMVRERDKLSEQTAMLEKTSRLDLTIIDLADFI